MKKQSFLLAGVAPAVLGLALISAPAYAQQSENDPNDASDQEVSIGAEQPAVGETIVVTGSRIKRREFDSAAPVAVIQDEEFKLSGTVNVENVLNTLPQVIPGTTSFSNNPGGGVATLDLRGLGAQRTLVLVNGRRYTFYDVSQVVDLNTIPQFLIDSVDVVTGGASAVYGSDAVSGVVNFRLRNDLVGVEAGGQYNITEDGDGRRYNAYVALGTDLQDGRGHATVYAEYYRRASVFQGDRDFSRFAQGDDGAGGFQPGGSSTLPAGVLRYNGGANTNGPRRLRDNPLTPAIEPTDNGIGAFSNNNAVVFDTPGTFRPRNGDVYNYAASNYLQVPQERYLLGGYADYEITDGITAYTEVTYVNNRVANELAATPVTGDFNVNLAAVQPFLSAASFANLQAIDAEETRRNGLADSDPNTPGIQPPQPDDPGVVNLAIQRRVVETGSRNTLDERNAFRVLVGLKGDITPSINYDAYYFYARTRNANVQAGNISRSAFQRGLDGTDPAINIFGPNTLSQASVDQISILAQNGDVSELQVASGSISALLGNLGFGGDDIGVAAGVEYRKVASEFIPDTALSSGDVIGFNGGDPTKGSYNVKEVFGELRIPIAGGKPGIERLELTGAGRYSDYSLGAVGGVYTYAGGVEYSPIRDITLRGQYQRAVRAPNVNELFQGLANGFPGATDPCAQPNAATDPTIRQLCIQSGVPGGAVGTAGLQLNDQIEGVFGGNPNLQEEKSDSYTFGGVLRPRFVPGLTVSADWFNIKVKDTIDTFGGGLNNSLDLCYNVVQDINSPFCQAFIGSRDASGALSGGPLAPSILNANIGKLETQGLDLQVSYSTAIPFSLLTDTGEQRLNFSFLGTYTDKYEITPVASLPDQVNECAGRFGQLACFQPKPKYKWTSRVSFVDGFLTTSVRWRHLGSVRDDNDAQDFTVEKVDAYNLIDLTFAADVQDNLTLALGVSNLFDKKPQIIGTNQEQANTYPGTYDVLGRDFFVSAAFRF